MAASIAAERRILGDDYATLAPSHYPALADLPAEEVLALARSLREQRDRLRGMLHTNRRARRGKGEARATAGNDVALARRKQVYAAALKRVNHRLEILQGEARRAWHAAALRDALARKRAARAHHPAAGDSADAGMHAKPSRKRMVRTDPREIGRVSAFVKAAQARRDR
ncbi:hypothetical protein [Neoroseomonas oryzicola]|uniref:Uncharacterized protein n=1 Tax=Neoroseomonas oryzicola TaxID=535904 RepID=A0A9X9WNC2_9PROT|nr:hypothetical protein [Neoroseomonas oryzicola]MBR0661832.1 hypothetical protein [Neoroseomonas oryzicola]NKE20053.1 hypothetical protein [Neoroseomonas oryzicola]